MITIDVYVLTAIVTTAVFYAFIIGKSIGIKKGITHSVNWFEEQGVVISDIVKKMKNDL